MAGVESYELLIMGGGKAGKTLAMDMARAGRRVALIERGFIGGSCINVACIPTKALIRAAEVAHAVRGSAAFGIGAGAMHLDMQALAARTAGIVAAMVDDHHRLFAEAGVELVIGEGRFVAPRVIEATLAGGGARQFTGERIFLNLGTVAAVPDLPGLRAAAPLTHVEALLLARLPRHLLILGGGYIGLEMAQAFRRLGSAVTIIERGPQLAAREDPDVAAAVLALFRDDGITVHLDAQVTGVTGRSGESVTLRLARSGGEDMIEGSDILVAAGRVPQTRAIGLEQAGVATDSAGFIVVDERLATTAPGIWALGEAAGSPMFTHVALDDYRIAKSVMLGGDRSTRGRLIPYAVFTDPELGRVGLNETEAQRQGIAYRVAKLPVAVIPRARTLSETRGLMKAVIAADGDAILGFTMLGAQAGEVITAVQAAMWGKLPYTAFRDGILAHPTMAEGLNLLFAHVGAPHRPALPQGGNNLTRDRQPS
jgi:pyruvate/2-oxoglutarate dehydrogenase complex dihydrolipoamide dehydrogenase (E3) component